MVPCRIQSAGRDSGRVNMYCLGGYPDHLILPKLELLSQQARSVKTILEEVRTMEKIQKPEQELGNWG